MIRRFQLFLGPARVRAFILLLGITGLISLALNTIVDEYAWVTTVQSLLAVGFIIGTAIIFGGRMRPEERLRWLTLLVPVIGAVILGVFFFPDLLPLFMGGGFGWIVAGLFIFRGRSRIEYQQAIKHMRRGEYAAAVKVLDAVIETEPDDANHYRLRAEILRLWGKLKRAQRDYDKMIALNPGDAMAAVAFNGLAEVYLQAKNYPQAHATALKAYTLAPKEWVTAYNLGMIEDRLVLSDEAIQHLHKALELKVPDMRHRLLIHLYLARAYARQGDLAAAESEVALIKQHKSGVEEWQVILNDDMASVLEAVLAADVQLTQDLIDGKVTPAELAHGNTK
jgi:predicted Zn-dependent protease